MSEKVINNIYDAIIVVSNISCSRCGFTEKTLGEDIHAAINFFDAGWYATENNVYCPACRNKMKSSTKNKCK